MKKQLLAVAGAVALFLILFFGFTNKPAKRSTYDDLREKLIDSLALPGEENLISLQKELPKSDTAQKAQLLNKLADGWEKAGQPALATDYLRQLADLQPSYTHYMVAGTSFLSLIASESRQDIRVNIVYGARYCFEQALSLKADDLDARIDLASVLVQGTSSPMDGIMMLRDIDQANPGNVKVNMQLGQFAIMSGQFDKAIERFDTVLQKDSLNLQSQYFMAQAYLGLQDTTNAIRILEKATSLETDSLVLSQVRSEIDHLKNN